VEVKKEVGVAKVVAAAAVAEQPRGVLKVGPKSLITLYFYFPVPYS
jgi:hypothetical protein